jgi:SAM-dependent methyltransferase
MFEQTKAAQRRRSTYAFRDRYFVGYGIDVGAGEDGLSKSIQMFPNIRGVREWDMKDGDAQYLEGIPDNTFDFLHSSHSLEHMKDVKIALTNWIRVVKPDGYLILTVPDEDLYEQGLWPSKYSDYHEVSFTIFKKRSWCPKSVNVLDLLREVGEYVSTERIELLTDFYDFTLEKGSKDQTFFPDVEAAIEIVLRKRGGGVT